MAQISSKALNFRFSFLHDKAFQMHGFPFVTVSWFLILLIVFNSCRNKKSLTITDHGKANYEIVIPENPDTLLLKSARFLQQTIEKIAGGAIGIVPENSHSKDMREIKLGFPEPDLSTHQILITNEGSNLIITGGNPQSTLNAVTVFLEEYLGCQWYTPDVEKITKTNTIELKTPVHYTYTPEITTRTVHSRLFYENPDFADKLRVTHSAFPGYVPVARVHTFHRFLPVAYYFASHPEYYALRNGHRLATQLCLSNPEVLQIVKDSVKALFEKYPDAQIISVSQNDNTQYCECDECRKIDESEGSPSGSMIRFVNAVAAEFPDKTISTLAYQYTRKPCKTKPAENVLITLCSIECDRSAPIQEKCIPFANDLTGWNKLTTNIRIWDYTTQFTNFLAPFPNIYTLQPNLKFFRDNHARWVFEQHSNQPSELFELRSYLMAKLLWNPDADVNEIIDDFVNGYYEEAGIFIKEYILLMYEELQNDPDFFLFLYGDPSQAFHSFLSAEMLTRYNVLFDMAEAAVSDKPKILARVKTARLSTDYASLEAARQNLSADFQMTVTDSKGVKTMNKLIVKCLDRFYKTCKAANITMMNEMRFSVEDYVLFYRKTLERAKMPDIALGAKVTLLTKPKKYADENPQALTDGALGGNSFYANWLGFEGNNMEAIIDLGGTKEIKHINLAFLQVSNHIVFFPEKVSCALAGEDKIFKPLLTVNSSKPLKKTSKINDIEYYDLDFPLQKARYIKLIATNRKVAPAWHNAAGLPAWIFCDEVLVGGNEK